MGPRFASGHRPVYDQLVREIRGRTGRDQRKLANNTYGRIEPDETVVVRYHSTDIVRAYPNGDTVYTSGGWRTQSTKERINRWLPPGIGLHQENHEWFLHLFGPSFNTYADFEDGITLDAYGKVLGVRSSRNTREVTPA
jgi:hypothetical protein